MDALISERDLGWLAAWFEGEGSFSFHGRCPRITAVQVQRWPLDRCLRLMGGSICMKPRVGRVPYYQWSHASVDTAGWMMTLYPLMSPRRKQQIETALALWRTRKPKDWRRRLTNCKRGHAFTEANTYLQKNGARNCRECLRMLWRRKNLRVINGDPSRDA
jgi:hypothetical protein